jgi:hypothetical protein
MKTPEQIAEKLIPMEREWLTGWQGPPGAAYNVIGSHMARIGLTRSYTDWNLNERGLAVRDYILEQTND